MMDMYKKLISILLIISFFSSCVTTGISGNANIIDGSGISVRGAIGERLEIGPLFTGNGGTNIRLAVYPPTIQGEVPEYLPIYIQGLL